MDWQHRILLTVFLILAAAIDGTHAYAMVTGTVYCDQCKDGQISFFDYPIYGIKVAVACADGNGQMTMWREETTNWFGNYAMRFDGTPDLSGCYAQVSGSGQGTMGCGAAAGPVQNLRLVFSMFDMEIYAVGSLLSQPEQPMAFCPRSVNPVPGPVTPTMPPPFSLPPMPRFPPMPPLPPLPQLPPLPPMPPLPQLPPSPPMPPLPPLPPMLQSPPLPPIAPLPPAPSLEASACSHKKWTMPEYKCYWRGVNPETKVAVVFGLLAARRYGTDITLWEGLQGRGDPYRTLLREGTTALLNSYNSIQFPYHTFDVIQHMNWALMGSPQTILLTALRFMRANSGSSSGSDTVTCKFTPCK